MENEKILCPSCMSENTPQEIFCSNCNMPIGQSATIDPVASAISEGLSISDAVREPGKLIIVIGMWIFYGVPIIAYLITIIGTLDISTFIIFGGLIVFCLILPILTTRNFIIKKKKGSSKPDFSD
jgi:ABC-type glucose/galactose transport system permease subunit